MKVVRVISSIVVLICIAAGLWSRIGVSAGNKLKDEANAAIQEAANSTAEAAKLYEKLVTDDTIKGLPGNRSQIKPNVDQAAALFEKSAAQFRLAASKLDEGAEKIHDSIGKEYWKTIADASRKRASQKDALRKIVLLLTDETVVDIPTFNTKSSPLVDEANKLNDESTAAEASATKMKAENPSKIN